MRREDKEKNKIQIFWFKLKKIKQRSMIPAIYERYEYVDDSFIITLRNFNRGIEPFRNEESSLKWEVVLIVRDGDGELIDRLCAEAKTMGEVIAEIEAKVYKKFGYLQLLCT